LFSGQKPFNTGQLTSLIWLGDQQLNIFPTGQACFAGFMGFGSLKLLVWLGDQVKPAYHLKLIQHFFNRGSLVYWLGTLTLD